MKDLRLDEFLDIVPGRTGFETIDGRDCVGQRVNVRLCSFFGEWFLDLDWGTPWYQRVLGVDGATDSDAELVVTQAILGTPGVLKMAEPVLSIRKRNTRAMAFLWVANTDYGAIGGITAGA